MNISEMRRVMDALGPDLDTVIQMKGPERELALIGAHAILHAFRPRILTMLDVVEAASLHQAAIRGWGCGSIEAGLAEEAVGATLAALDTIP